MKTFTRPHISPEEIGTQSHQTWGWVIEGQDSSRPLVTLTLRQAWRDLDTGPEWSVSVNWSSSSAEDEPSMARATAAALVDVAEVAETFDMDRVKQNHERAEEVRKARREVRKEEKQRELEADPVFGVERMESELNDNLKRLRSFDSDLEMILVITQTRASGVQRASLIGHDFRGLVVMDGQLIIRPEGLSRFDELERGTQRELKHNLAASSHNSEVRCFNSEFAFREFLKGLRS